MDNRGRATKETTYAQSSTFFPQQSSHGKKAFVMVGKDVLHKLTEPITITILKIYTINIDKE